MYFRWQGPLSIAVYAPGTDFQKALDSILYYRFPLLVPSLKLLISRAGWPHRAKRSQKVPKGPGWPSGTAGVLRRRLIHRNGTFVPQAPPTRTRRQVKTDFRRKPGRSGPFFHQSGRFQGVERAKFRCRRSRLFGFSRRWPESGRFGRFSGPRGLLFIQRSKLMKNFHLPIDKNFPSTFCK